MFGVWLDSLSIHQLMSIAGRPRFLLMTTHRSYVFSTRHQISNSSKSNYILVTTSNSIAQPVRQSDFPFPEATVLMPIRLLSPVTIHKGSLLLLIGLEEEGNGYNRSSFHDSGMEQLLREHLAILRHWACAS